MHIFINQYYFDEINLFNILLSKLLKNQHVLQLRLDAICTRRTAHITGAKRSHIYFSTLQARRSVFNIGAADGVGMGGVSPRNRKKIEFCNMNGAISES